MAASKSVLGLFTQPLQRTTRFTSPSSSLCAASSRRLHQTSLNGCQRPSAQPQPPFHQCASSRGTTSGSTWMQSRVTGRANLAPSFRLQQRRRQHSSASSSPSPSSASASTQDPKQLPTLSELEQQRTSGPSSTSQSIDVSAPKPEYLLQFTCKKCTERSTHKVSKQAYHGGTVLVQCPGCKVRHLVADHLGIFSDEKVTLEDIMASKGEKVRKGKAELRFAPNGDGVVEVQKSAESPESPEGKQ